MRWRLTLFFFYLFVNETVNSRALWETIVFNTKKNISFEWTFYKNVRFKWMNLKKRCHGQQNKFNLKWLNFVSVVFLSFFPPFILSCLYLRLCFRWLYSLSLDVIIFVLVSYCRHFNSGAPQSGLTQTARNHTSQPVLQRCLLPPISVKLKVYYF